MFRLLLCAALLGTTVALVAQTAAAQDSPEEVVERIRELQREINELLERLPPDLREEVRRSLASPPSAESPAAEPPPGEPSPVTVSSVPPPAPPPSPRRRSRTACNTLSAFDTDGSGTVDARDRYWRHLYLWLDRDGDGTVEEREIVTPFDRKVREIAVDLDGFVGRKGLFGEIRIGERLTLDLKGDGIEVAGTGDDAVLLVDADALRRGDGPDLLSADGVPITGVQPFARGWRLRDPGGAVTPLTCP